jgi:hypothetical protein
VFHRQLALGFIVFAGFAPTMRGQATDSSAAPSYLMRLVHARTYENLCVLVRGDGQYHLERETAQKTDVFEGTLPPPELQRVEHFLSANELFELADDKSLKPTSAGPSVQIILSVHRPGRWQNLTFATPDSWQSFHESVVPLIAWLDELRKAKNRVKLKEEIARNNCLPPPKLELKTR